MSEELAADRKTADAKEPAAAFREGETPVEVQPAEFQALERQPTTPQPRSLDLLMDVPVGVSVELGRTRMLIRDIVQLGPGSIVQLDKLAGEPVELLVNERLVARGEVVVIDENFGFRVSQIVSPEERTAPR